MPQWPYVESDSEWVMTSMYYGPSSTPERIEGKDDIDSYRYLLAPTLHKIAVLGGSIADITDTALLAVSHSVMNEMMVTTTAETLENLAELCGASLDAEFAARLVERADTIATGMAHVGALRSVAWACSRGRLTEFRPKITRMAREGTRRVKALSGYANLVADDAHAHLRAAEQIQPPEDEDGKKRAHNAIFLCATTGCTLLAMSFAEALLEPWNPFLARRLSAELAEHRQTLSAVSEFEPDLGAQLDEVRGEMDSLWDDTTAKWKSRVERGQYDIAAYMDVRREAPPAPDSAQLSSLAAALHAGEPDFERFL